MILHSIIARDDIFCKNSLNVPVYREIDGGFLELEGDEVKRLYSTNPYLYLDKRYEPYSKIKNGR